jgi:hypothetical protein
MNASSSIRRLESGASGPGNCCLFHVRVERLVARTALEWGLLQDLADAPQGQPVRADIGDPSRFASHWPGNAGYGAGGAATRPRSATIVITRNDAGLIGADGDQVLNTF